MDSSTLLLLTPSDNAGAQEEDANGEQEKRHGHRHECEYWIQDLARQNVGESTTDEDGNPALCHKVGFISTIYRRHAKGESSGEKERQSGENQDFHQGNPRRIDKGEQESEHIERQVEDSKQEPSQ